MTVPTEEPGLADGFEPASVAQWRALALAVARKAGIAGDTTSADEVDRLLATATYDGIEIAPLYTAPPATAGTGMPGATPFTRGAGSSAGVVSGWDVRQRHADPDPAATNAAALDDLENGATSLWLVLGPHGLAVDHLPAALGGVHLDLAGVVLDAGDQFDAAARTLTALVEARGTSPAEVSGSLGADPIGWRARTGRPADVAAAARWAARCAASLPRLRAVTVDATVFHDAGGADAEELGCALAAGVGYLRAITDAGVDIRDAFAQIEFRYAVNADQFLGIAKLRAARRLWARVAQACGVPGAGAQRQHAVTSAAMTTARDPWVNLLRATLACFAAGVGGAQAVTVLPFDHRLGRPDRFARRLARNTQSLLIEESHVGRVVDPAGGSWYVEHLTDALAERAWDWFTEIERAGGVLAALDAGLVAERLDATWRRRAANLAHRRDPITGVSEFPHLGEELPIRPPAVPEPGGGLPRHHYAEPFERIRDRVDAHTAATGVRPTVFLATLGPVSAHTARAGFAANLLAAGGIATVTGGADDPDAAARAFTGSGATVACLCGTDKAYAESAAPVARSLRAAGARRVWLAGRPADHAGVDAYLFSGCDAVGVLDQVLADLEVTT